jgi:uncharacterized protein (TIRG00374 family)
VLLVAVGVALLYFLVDYSGWDKIRELLHRIDKRLALWAMLLFVAQLFAMSLRWWVALRLTGYPARLVSCIRANSASNIINFVAPGHFGEPFAGAWLGKTRRGPGVESFALLIACKAVAMVINGVVLIACIPLLLADAQNSALGQAVALTVLTFVMAGGVFVLVLHPRTSSWGIGKAARLARLLLRSEAAADKVQAMTERFRDAFVLFSRAPRALVAVSLIAAVKIVCLIAVMSLIYEALGHPVSLFAATFLESIDGLGNIVAIWIPGNLGLQEIIHSSAAAGGLGIDLPTAVFAALLVKLFMVVHILVAGVLWLVLAPFDPPGTMNSTQDSSVSASGVET